MRENLARHFRARLAGIVPPKSTRLIWPKWAEEPKQSSRIPESIGLPLLTGYKSCPAGGFQAQNL